MTAQTEEERAAEFAEALARWRTKAEMSDAEILAAYCAEMRRFARVQVRVLEDLIKNGRKPAEEWESARAAPRQKEAT